MVSNVLSESLYLNTPNIFPKDHGHILNRCRFLEPSSSHVGHIVPSVIIVWALSLQIHYLVLCATCCSATICDCSWPIRVGVRGCVWLKLCVWPILISGNTGFKIKGLEWDEQIHGCKGGSLDIWFLGAFTIYCENTFAVFSDYKIWSCNKALVFEAIIVVVTLVGLKRLPGRSTLMDMLLTQGIGYFVVVFVVHLVIVVSLLFRALCSRLTSGCRQVSPIYAETR